MPTGTAGTTARRYQTSQVHYLKKAFAYSDGTSTYTLGTIPTGGIVIDAGVAVSTAFNSGTSDTLLIGTADDTNGLATLLDLQTAGLIAADELATSDDIGPYTADTVMKAVFTATGTAATTGAATVFITYIVDNG